MRFIANGLEIPDELLLARDQGRVVFFCGAGVSCAEAHLPDFFELAEKVIEKLGLPANSAVYKVLSEAPGIEKRTGVAGLISADRIFGLLEREFDEHHIAAAVASTLKPGSEPNLTAHKILLDLATTQEGIVRLVTTNFDRLFEDCGRKLNSWQPPHLPELANAKDMNGVVYLHGKVTPDYQGAEGDGFVLSSAEFGRAYLSDGWAASFFRKIIDKYVVVFVGYSADDPPIHYLLEALNKGSKKLGDIYAFQSGDINDANSRWRHKGVKAIPYDESDNHCMLWHTLEAWAQRARDPDCWYAKTIEMARQGPEELLPHERGQVAHIVSTREGLRKFSEGDNPPPAEWLCVFDSHRRYAMPRRPGNDLKSHVDPFDIYGIDTDKRPPAIDPKDFYTKRKVPQTAWDAFALNHTDKADLSDDSFSTVRGQWAAKMPRLSPRLAQMGAWIRQISNQPASVWWAAHQKCIHPDIQAGVRWALQQSNPSVEIRKAWDYLFEYWQQDRYEAYEVSQNFIALEKEIQREGWSDRVVRKYSVYCRPFIKVEAVSGPIPPARDKETSLTKLMRLDVEYSTSYQEIFIPDDWVASIVMALRKNLEIARQLETEIGGYEFINLSLGFSGHNQSSHCGLPRIISEFLSIFERLMQLDLATAKREFSQWLTEDNKIFSQLRIWGANKPELVSDNQFASVFVKLGEQAFWDFHHTANLLSTLSSRWASLNRDARAELEARLLNGPPRWERETSENFRERKAWSILSYINGLSNSGCAFDFGLKAETERLSVFAPNWKPEYADNATESAEIKFGWRKTNTEYSPLLFEPLVSVLSKAFELNKKGSFFIEHDPYAGLSRDYPVRAFSALRLAAKQQHYPEWAWRTFLYSEARKNDKPKFVALIAEHLSRYPGGAIASFVNALADWFLSVSETLASHCPELFDRVTKMIIRVLPEKPQKSVPKIALGSQHIDWITVALNAPAGKVAQALFYDPRIKEPGTEKYCLAEWLGQVDLLLALPNDLRRYVLAIFIHKLDWFYAMAPEWSEKNLFIILESGDLVDKHVFWNGFFSREQELEPQLYQCLKPYFLQLAKEGRTTCSWGVNVIPGIILMGWGGGTEGTGERYISNTEFREVLWYSDDEFRACTLRLLERWSSDSKDDTENKWESLLVELIKDVWPLRRSVKSSAMSVGLCEIVFSSEENFSMLAELIIPLLSRIDADFLALPNVYQTRKIIIDRHPKQMLSLLNTVLPEDASNWSYEFGDVINQICEADETLKTDNRLLELKRKWNAR